MSNSICHVLLKTTQTDVSLYLFNLLYMNYFTVRPMQLMLTLINFDEFCLPLIQFCLCIGSPLEGQKVLQRVLTGLIPLVSLLLDQLLLLTSEWRTVDHALEAVGWNEASQMTKGFTHRAGIFGQAFYVLESHVDDLIGAGVAVEVTAGETFQSGLVRDAALAVRNI